MSCRLAGPDPQQQQGALADRRSLLEISAGPLRGRPRPRQPHEVLEHGLEAHQRLEHQHQIRHRVDDDASPLEPQTQEFSRFGAVDGPRSSSFSAFAVGPQVWVPSEKDVAAGWARMRAAFDATPLGDTRRSMSPSGPLRPASAACQSSAVDWAGPSAEFQRGGLGWRRLFLLAIGSSPRVLSTPCEWPITASCEAPSPARSGPAETESTFHDLTRRFRCVSVHLVVSRKLPS